MFEVERGRSRQWKLGKETLESLLCVGEKKNGSFKKSPQSNIICNGYNLLLVFSQIIKKKICREFQYPDHSVAIKWWRGQRGLINWKLDKHSQSNQMACQSKYIRFNIPKLALTIFFKFNFYRGCIGPLEKWRYGVGLGTLKTIHFFIKIDRWKRNTLGPIPPPRLKLTK